MNKYKYWLKIALFEIILIIFDQITKYWATISLKGKNEFNIIKDVLCFHYLDGGNTGAAWGLLSGKTFLFVIFTLVAIAFIVKIMSNIFRLMRSDKSTKLVALNYVFATLMAGAVGNLIDRVLHQYVIDFIYFKLINFPIFNVADIYVTVSCFIIIVMCAFIISEDDFNNIISLKRNDSR